MTLRLLRLRWLFRPFVSVRATRPDGCRLHVLPAQGASEVRHRLPVPLRICPISRNPVAGEIEIIYLPALVVAEVVSLHRLVNEAPKHSRNVEGLAKWIHGECRRALDVSVEVVLTLTIRPGPQGYVVRFDG